MDLDVLALRQLPQPGGVEVAGLAALGVAAEHAEDLVAQIGDLRLGIFLLERGLDNIFGVVTEEAMHRLVRDEVEQPEALDRATDGLHYEQVGFSPRLTRRR